MAIAEYVPIVENSPILENMAIPEYVPIYENVPIVENHGQTEKLPHSGKVHYS